MIQRPNYLRKMIEAQGNEFVKVITGVRRSGKSSLLDLFSIYLREKGVREDSIN